VSDWRHILVWEVSTIAIPGQRLLERCDWSFGDYKSSLSIVGEETSQTPSVELGAQACPVTIYGQVAG
jgi:hypothetical protein